MLLALTPQEEKWFPARKIWGRRIWDQISESVPGPVSTPEIHSKTTADPSTHHPQAEKRLEPRSLRMTAQRAGHCAVLEASY